MYGAALEQGALRSRVRRVVTATRQLVRAACHGCGKAWVVAADWVDGERGSESAVPAATRPGIRWS